PESATSPCRPGPIAAAGCTSTCAPRPASCCAAPASGELPSSARARRAGPGTARIDATGPVPAGSSASWAGYRRRSCSRLGLHLIEARRILEIRPEELRHRAALEAVHEAVIEGDAEGHDRARDLTAIIHHGPVLHLDDHHDERRAADRLERPVCVP